MVDICPGRSISWAPNWGRNVKCLLSADTDYYDLHNVECQRLLPSGEISPRSTRFAKRAVANLSDVFRVSFSLQQSAPSCIWLMAASQCFHIATVANDFALILYLRHNRKEWKSIAHSACLHGICYYALLRPMGGIHFSGMACLPSFVSFALTVGFHCMLVKSLRTTLSQATHIFSNSKQKLYANASNEVLNNLF